MFQHFQASVSFLNDPLRYADVYDACRGLLYSMKTVSSCSCLYLCLDFFRSGFVVVCLSHEFLFNLFYDTKCATRLTGI